MTPEAMRVFLRSTSIGTRVEVIWRYSDELTQRIDIGSIVALAKAKLSADIKYDELGTQPFPPTNTNVVIMKVRLCRAHGHAFLPETINMVTHPMPVNMPPQVTYADGGCTVGTGCGSAGIHVETYENNRKTTTAKHSRYYVKTTNNVMEYVGLIAALRHALRTRKRTLIVVDSLVILNQLRGIAKCHTKHLIPLLLVARELFAQVADFVMLAHMSRAEGNPADDVVKDARRNGTGEGDASLFEEVAPVEGRRQKAPTHPVAPIDLRDIEYPTISSVEDFARVRFFKSRSRCPEACQSLWATAVRQHLMAIFASSTDGERDTAMINFMLLPTLFLPTSASTTRIASHLSGGAPFSLDLDKRKPHTSADNRDRLSKAVERLAADRKIKAAVKLLQDSTDTDDDFDAKVAKLRAKFIARADDIKPHEPTTTSPFTSFAVRSILRKISRNAANCIDGWTKDLFAQAVDSEPVVADLLAVLCAHVNDGIFGELVMDIIRLGRLVGIPKREGGIRPIVVSSMISRLTGGLILQRAKVKCSDSQYAINVKDGAMRIVHLAREAVRNGKTIIRIDSSNAFNVAPRARIRELLDLQEPDVLQYFMTIYEPRSKLCVYGGNRTIAYVDSEEGVRQGDAFSAFFFCLLMDVLCNKLKSEFPDNSIWSYMDDLTIACDGENADQVALRAVEIMNELGFKPNTDKSACLTPDDDFTSSVFPRTARTNEHFDMLGGNISDNFEVYNAKQTDRLSQFFANLAKVDIHPQLRWTFLRMCGLPKLRYYAATTPPEHSQELLDAFDNTVHTLAEEIIRAPIADVFLHHEHGAGFPNYPKHAEMLYTLSRDTALTGARRVPPVKLVANEPLPSTASLSSQYEAPYLFYARDTNGSYMEESHFIIAMNIRLRTLPDTLVTLPKRCRCGHLSTNHCDVIEHCLACDRSTHYTHTHRHNDVRDVLAAVARSFGISVTVEPRFYEECYDTVEAQRPDITFHTTPKIATDVTIVTPHTDVGIAAEQAAKEKRKIHTAACARLGHTFIPFAMETYGHKDKSCLELISALKRHIPEHLHKQFAFAIHHGISTALARARAATVISAISMTRLH